MLHAGYVVRACVLYGTVSRKNDDDSSGEFVFALISVTVTSDGTHPIRYVVIYKRTKSDISYGIVRASCTDILRRRQRRAKRREEESRVGVVILSYQLYAVHGRAFCERVQDFGLRRGNEFGTGVDRLVE